MSYQSQQPCIACGTMGTDRCYHHVKSRGSGGPDEAWNMISVCLACHNNFHLYGNMIMTERFPAVLDWFKLNGWEILSGKWRNV